MDLGTCRLCGREALLLRASHLVPASLYRHMKPGSASFGVLTGHALLDTRTAAVPVAADLLCSACDNDLLGALDFYAHHVLAGCLPGTRRDGDTRTIEPSHYARLKLFLWSVFWRTAVSGDDRFAILRSLPLEELRRRLLANDPGEPDMFPISIVVSDRQEGAWQAWTGPADAPAVIAGRYAFIWGGPVTLHRERLEIRFL